MECKVYLYISLKIYILHLILQILLTHGYCHLLGYDHESNEQWKMMYNKELHILDEYAKLTGISLKPITQQGH